ncbi:glycosyltransferase family protein [Williamwhitmania taraxaci]|uniref:Phosphatidylinositol glycan, class B n=1 Tax=Williamwhitmania taraxaci TaxID=1640674 RepID=A0A1G6GUZ8_9BACT|nr:hypothetical protein [Williamwhitmania taraxaci]SDB85870.1 phosphatidylinositol glycan, class B [Williamwhitmania taraxaci]
MAFKYKQFNFFYIVFLVAAVVYLITAYNSHGYYHADEHYQIVEFSGIKLGTHAPSDLAWEYEAKLRPALQPTICFLVFSGLKSTGETNPYTMVMWLRILTALLSLVIITFFIKQTLSLFSRETDKKAYILLSYFLWFIPLLSVRFSSETMSGLMLLLALALLHKKESNYTPWLLGLVFGLGFLFRFQVAFVIAGIGLWLIFIRNVNFRYLLKIAAVFFLIVGVGTLIDSWFYGQFVFTPFNYYKANILEDVASSFGTSPWYFYLGKLITLPSYFVGIPLAIAFVVVAVYNPRSIYLWCIIPLFVVHSIIPHKEERFLFPIVFLFPIIVMLAWEKVAPIFGKRRAYKSIRMALIVLFALANGVGVVAMSVKAAGVGRIGLTKHIHDNYGDKHINLIYNPWCNPYNPWGLPVKFYLEKDLEWHALDSLGMLTESLIKPNAVNLLVVGVNEAENPVWQVALSQKGFVEEARSIPNWEAWINRRYKAFDKGWVLVLYRRKPQEVQ